MAERRNRGSRRAAPYPPRQPISTPSISKFTPINAPINIPPPPNGGAKTQQGGSNRHEALRQAPIGTSTVRMLVGDTTAQPDVPTAGTTTLQNDRPVEDYDATPDESPFGVPTQDDLQYWNRSASSFIRSSSGIDATWVGRRPLGQGSFGIAGVWEKYDHNGNMIDTVVIKQIGLRPKDAARGHAWDSQIPHEVLVHFEINAVECDTIVRIRSYKRYPHQQIHRIYLEYCPYGDLRKLYKRYRQFRRYLPETYIWETFRHLLKAVGAMHFGPINAETGQREWDFEIVHRDLKPQNVFLGKEGPLNSPFPFYPTAKIGDFGLAEMTSGEDPNNPLGLQGAGTRIYMAPEQKVLTGAVPPYLANGHNRLGHETNLWAVGATMYELLTLHHAYSALYPWDIDEEGEGLPVIRTTRTPEYSAELRQMIRMCLRPDPTTRPDFEQLYADVNQRVEEIAMASQRLRGQNQLAVHQSERLYYRGNEINSMQIGDWAPTHYYVLDEVEESGFKDPDLTTMRFPKWNRRAATGEEETTSQSDPDEDVRRIMAESMLVAGGTGATAPDDVTMGTDRTNSNDDAEGEDDDEMGDATVVPATPTTTQAAQNQNRQGLNRFGKPKMAW